MEVDGIIEIPTLGSDPSDIGAEPIGTSSNSDPDGDPNDIEPEAIVTISREGKRRLNSCISSFFSKINWIPIDFTEYYLASFYFPRDGNRGDVPGFSLDSHVDCYFSGEITTTGLPVERMPFSKSSRPLVIAKRSTSTQIVAGDNVYCLSSSFRDYKGDVSAKMVWNMVDRGDGRHSEWEKLAKGKLNWAIIFYEGIFFFIISYWFFELMINSVHIQRIDWYYLLLFWPRRFRIGRGRIQPRLFTRYARVFWILLFL
jgi:hypothetical protein